MYSSIIIFFERENENAKSTAFSKLSKSCKTVIPFDPEESTGLTIIGRVKPST